MKLLQSILFLLTILAMPWAAVHAQDSKKIEMAGLAGPDMQHLAPKLAKRGFVVIWPKNYPAFLTMWRNSSHP